MLRNKGTWVRLLWTEMKGQVLPVLSGGDNWKCGSWPRLALPCQAQRKAQTSWETFPIPVQAAVKGRREHLKPV